MEEVNAKIKFIKSWVQETMPFFKGSDKIFLAKGGVIAVGKLNNSELDGQDISI